jgi:uncharacterized protein YndB with AHSA1/START domain
MNSIITILLVIVGIIAILLICGLFIKKEFLIERSIIIHRSKQEVFNYLKILKNGEHYNKWMMADPAMKKTLTGTDGTVGFIYAWESTGKNAGKGEQEITKINEGERIESELRFEKPFKNTSYASFVIQGVSADQAKVTWAFHGNMNYPMNLIHALLNLSKMLGKDLETSLSNLKTILEKN